jgi:hypothetical protein
VSPCLPSSFFRLGDSMERKAIKFGRLAREIRTNDCVTPLHAVLWTATPASHVVLGSIAAR